MDDRARRKSALRKQLRERRRSLATDTREQANTQCAQTLLQWEPWRRCRHVGVYLANDGEMDTQLIAASAHPGKQLYLPVIREQDLLFSPWTPGEMLKANRYGIGEPIGEATSSSVLQLVLMPLVGWSRDGNRLGMGGGFYDRCLRSGSAASALRVGLAFDCQLIAEADARNLWDDWDLPLDAVATESTVYLFNEKTRGTKSK